jgi:proline iminopeptidase
MMPRATARDGTKLYYEEAGTGTPLLFIHEYAGDWRSWEPQMRYFARRYRCIAYSSRGYPGSDVPVSPDAYSYEQFRDDAIAVLDHVDVETAHIVGLSMGGYSTLQVGLAYPDRARSLTLAGTGSGSERWYVDEFREHSRATADEMDRLGMEEVAKSYGSGATRMPFAVKDPRGYAEFMDYLASHDTNGAANTLRGFQAGRPSLYEFEDAIANVSLPTLIVVGDEDDPCLEPSLWLKQTMPTAGLTVFPKTGHTVSLEEPALFNTVLESFLASVEQGRWPARQANAMTPARAQMWGQR